MAIPRSDEIFSERTSKTVTRISGKLSDSLRERGAILQMYPQLLREKHTKAHGRPFIHNQDNPYVSYKNRLRKEVIMTALKFIFGYACGALCVIITTKYFIVDPTLILDVIPEQVPGPSTLLDGPSVDSSQMGERILDISFKAIECIDIGINLSIGITALGLTVIPAVTPFVAPVLLWLSPLLYLGLYT